MYGGYPIVGAVHDPQHDEMYSVSRGDKLHLNGRPISADSAWPRTKSRRLLVGIPSSMHGTAYTLMRNWTSGVVVAQPGLDRTAPDHGGHGAVAGSSHLGRQALGHRSRLGDGRCRRRHDDNGQRR